LARDGFPEYSINQGDAEHAANNFDKKNSALSVSQWRIVQELNEMTLSDERLKILKMIDEGKISAEEGAKLLAALAQSRRPERKATVTGTGTGARWLRIRVTDMKNGRAKATVNLPLGLVDAGLNIASQYAPDVDFDELISAINAGAEGKIIDVLDEEDGEHVEIYIE
jgi:SHOCT-like domain